MRNLWKFVPLVVLVAATWDCGGEPGHRGTPSDPNQQQGNPNAQPENSIVKGKVGDQPSGDKTGKDLTLSNSAEHRIRLPAKGDA